MKNHFLLKEGIIFLLCVFGCTANIAIAQNQSLNLLLSFNQPKYVSGDTAFFRGRLFSGDRKPVPGKKVISLKLVDSEGKLRFHNRVVFQDGSCANQFVLAIEPNQYSLTASNEDQALQENSAPFFSMPFTVVGEKKFADKANAVQQIPTEAGRQFASIKTDKENYSVRQLVNVQVNVADANDKPLEGDFSAAVIYNDLFDESAIPTSLGLPTTDLMSSAMPIGNTRKAMAYYFKGKVVSDNVLEDSTMITFYLNRNDFVYPLYTNATGYFEFPLFKDFGDERIYYKISHKGVPVNGTIILDQPKVMKDSLKMLAVTGEEDKYTSFTKKRNVVMKSFLYYANRLPKGDAEEWLDSDFDIELDKFEPFSSMSELLGNIVQMVRYRKKDNEEMVRVFLRDNAIYATSDPLYIIDGVMMDNTKYFLNLLPANVERIGILRSQETLSRYGQLGKNGILLVRTKSTSREELPTNPHELFVTGINKSVSFKAPSYANEKQVQIPDLRSTLYWNPKIVMDNQGKVTFLFYTGDATGNFKIRIEGMTKSGISFSKEAPFTVSYEKP